MDKLIDDFRNGWLIDPNEIKRLHIHIKDDALKFIDNMLDNRIIDHLLSYEGFTPEMRKFFPSHFLRAELLKALKYPEISYRKFCGKDYMGPERIENREFIGLPFGVNRMIDHSQLSKFRGSMTFSQSANLLTYVICHFRGSGILKGGVLHAVDSTELFNDNWRPLFSTEIEGQKIRVYEDLDCDCGVRRNKRDKSKYFIGYRMHTLTIVDAKTGHAFPLASLVAAGNHHDSLLLKPLIQLAQAMGIEVKLVAADEAYHDNNGFLFEETGACLIKPPAAKTKLPDNTDSETLEVVLDDMCEIAMTRIGPYISLNWRGKPLASYEVVVNLISSTTTKGLEVMPELDTNTYKKGIKVSDEDFKKINIRKDEFHGEWNYRIVPQCLKRKL